MWFQKCNVGGSWDPASGNCGASWILRDAQGAAILHSRRSFAEVSSTREAELLSLCWAVESLHSLCKKNVIVESPFALAREAMLLPQNLQWLQHLMNDIHWHLPFLGLWSLEQIDVSRNAVPEAIALSVTRDQRLHSYVATGGPH